MKPNAPLTGLIAAPHTPMHADGRLNEAAIERQAEWLVTHGVSGAFICGTTGEGLSLTVSERIRVADQWCRVARGKLAIVVHTGHACLHDARELASHAEKCGADAVAAMIPALFKPRSVAELVDCCAQIASASPGLPFYYYHIPSMTGLNFSMADFLHEASARIANLAGVKFTHEDLMDLHQCLRVEQGRFNLLFGRDEILLSALVLGARGAVGSTYNFAAPIYLRMMAAFAAGDLATAEQEQARAAAMIRTLNRYGGLAAGKAVMKMFGLDCGPVRLPLRDLTADQYQALATDLERIGFFESARQRA